MSSPDADGWYRDPGFLRLLFELGGILDGDEIDAVEVDSEPPNYMGRHTARISGERSVNYVCQSYGNEELANSHWKIIGWRRPLKEKP